MATYLILNIIFSLIVVLTLRLSKILMWNRVAAITLIVVLLCTAVFDSLIIHYSIVSYNQELILGITVAKAPIEDFFYPVIAVIFTVSIWNLFDRKVTKDEKNPTTI